MLAFPSKTAGNATQYWLGSIQTSHLSYFQKVRNPCHISNVQKESRTVAKLMGFFFLILDIKIDCELKYCDGGLIGSSWTLMVEFSRIQSGPFSINAKVS